MDTDLIHQLRDIHLPAPISIWPLAIGWIILLILGAVVLFSAGYIALQRWRKHHCLRIVLVKLAQLEQLQKEGQCIARDLSMLLKRAALYSYPRRDVAGLHGESWLKFLDESSNTTLFTQGEGRNLITYPYKSQASSFSESLFNLIRQWVKQNL